MANQSHTGPVLVVGATGRLGGQVVSDLLDRGKQVRALVRPTTNADKLERLGVEIARGDMLDLDSLVGAMNGVDAVITTAAGYTRGDRNAHDIDTIGNSNLAQAAHLAGVRRFVLTSILTCDQTPEVSHFWHKKLAEDKLEELGVPFVALRPGAFLDQIATRSGNLIEKGQLMWMGRKEVPLTFVLTSDLAGYLAAAVDVEAEDGERIDIGWDRPATISEIAVLLGRAAGKSIEVTAIQPAITTAAGAPDDPTTTIASDMAAMFRWFDGGKYVADTTRQAAVFGVPPTAEDATARLVAQLRQ